MTSFDPFDDVSLEDDDLCLADDALFHFKDEGGVFDARASADVMDFDFEVLDIEAAAVADDANSLRSQVESEAFDFDPGARRGGRHPSPSPHAHERRQQGIAAVGLGPPPRPQRPSLPLPPPPRREPHRRASDPSAPTCASSHDPQADQLQRLADSMRRSVATRRHVLAMRREALPPEQRRALGAARELLHRQAMLSGRMASFFENGSFTRGLEESRRRIGLYIGRINHGTM